MKYLLPLVALAEGGLGVVLLVYPPIVWLLLLGVDQAEYGSGAALAAVSRVAGITLIALAVACWPGVRPIVGMLVYSTLVALYLAMLGLQGGLGGPMLWPAVVLHVVLSLLMVRAWLRDRVPATH